MTTIEKAKPINTKPAYVDAGTKHIRHGVGAMRPSLQGYPDTWKLVRHAFEALEIERESFGPNNFHLEALVGDSVVVLEISDPPHPESFPGSVYVYAEDIDKSYDRALEVGAVTLQPPTNKPYNERQACVGDSFGNVFWIATFKRPTD